MPDPIRPSWLQKYLEAHGIAADATAVKGPQLPAQRTIRATPTRSGLPEPMAGPLGWLLSKGEEVHNAVASRLQKYNLDRAMGDAGSVSGTKDIGEGLASRNLGQIGLGALALGMNVVPELKAEKAVAPAAFREVEPEAFHSALSQFAKERPSEAGFITWRSPEEMRAEKMRTFLAPDDKTGYAIHPESGDIRNVFNYGEKGRGAHAVADALANNGGKVLDAFDTNLGNFYRDMGFNETWRSPWDDQYRPSNWDAKYGTPDVIGMEHPLAGKASAADLLAQYDANRAARRTPVQAPAVVTPPSSGDVFDVSRLGTQIPDGVTTERPPVKYPTARADVSMLNGIPRKFREVYTPNVLKALQENPQAAGWYDMTQVRDAMKDLSPTGGEDFAQFMKFMGPTSSGTKVPENLRHASKFYQLWKTGKLSLDDLLNGTLDLPTGYKNRRQSSVNSGIAKIVQNGNLDPLEQPKTFRYSNQLAGNAWGGAALDMHVGRQVGKKGVLLDKDGNLVPGFGFPTTQYADKRLVSTSPNNLHYGLIEDPLVREADKLGLAPAQYQALGWVGGAGQTNVADSRTLLDIFNEKLRTTAAKYGYQSPLDAFKAFVSGETPLWAAAPFLAAPQGNDRKK